MIINTSNAKHNTALLGHHCAYQFTDSNSAIEFVEFLNWLLPYQCENIDHQFELISKCMDEKGVCYIGLTYFNFDKQIDYATRIDLAISHRPPFMSVYNQSCFKKPYFSIKDRCLRLLDTVSRRQLINLKIAYV
jgi:hypothetical protein